MSTASALEMVFRSRQLGVMRVSATGAITAVVLFLGCWLATYLPFGTLTHGYLTIFTSADIRSGIALAQGLCWSTVAGALVGAVIAGVYNSLSMLDNSTMG